MHIPTNNTEINKIKFFIYGKKTKQNNFCISEQSVLKLKAAIINLVKEKKIHFLLK